MWWLEGGALKQTQPYRAQHNLELSEAPLAQRVSYPFSHMPRPDSIIFRSACSPPTQFVSARTSTSHTSPPSRRYASRAAGRSERIPHTLWNRNRTPLACASARACSHKGTVHSQPAVASRRCPPSWPPHERPWPKLRVADTIGGRNPHRRRDVCTPNGRPPAIWRQNPRAVPHTHA